MKYLLFILFFWGPVTYAQVDPVILPVDSTTGSVQFREVVMTDPAADTKALMQRARTWVAMAYRSANDVVQQFDPDAGILIVKGQFTMNHVYRKGKPIPAKIAIYHMLTIEAKPGRYRATMNSFEQEAGMIKAPIRANHGSMTEEEYLAEVKKSAVGSGMEKMVMRYAEKNVDTGLMDARLYTADVKTEVLSILNRLKLQMVKKPDKDW